MHFFRLTDGGVQCGERGLFVGSTPMLRHSRGRGDRETWFVRQSDELDRELSEAYGFPVDVAVKREALSNIARALTQGDVALAQIAALLLRFPDPPSLSKGTPARGSSELAERLIHSGLLRGAWDESLHPRTGEPPNRGWFAAVPHDSAANPLATRNPGAEATESEPLWRKALTLARPCVRKAAEAVAERWSLAAYSVPIIDAIDAVLVVMKPSPTNSDEERVLAQLRASLDPPKTLAELQTPPTQNALGYERHHIVEQNPDNIAKSPIEIVIEKFGRAAVDDPGNVVWVPRYKHELITAFYNSKEDGDLAGRLHRRLVNDRDYGSQYAAGLEALRRFGVLQ
jgi:hypothetical protein